MSRHRADEELLGKAQAEGVELPGPDGLLSQVTKAVLERALAEEMTGHLGYAKHDPAGRGSGNNGVPPDSYPARPEHTEPNFPGRDFAHGHGWGPAAAQHRAVAPVRRGRR